MTNQLAKESSPYLQQHAENPVWWYPWGDKAFAEARKQGKPILLSVGYAACHWCHVMAHESFEDPETAAIMNEHFVNVKVDREERPDVDSIYMKAVVALTGQGGWPMTVALTPDGEPFYGGTYFPPTPRYGMPSFRQVLLGVSEAWQERRQKVIQSAGRLTEHLNQTMLAAGGGIAIEDGMLDEAILSVRKQFDAQLGGFGGAPKFPQAMTIDFLLRYYVRFGNKSALHMAERTLEMMAKGGMYDQLGGGFARYSTDNKWLVPHFEKMLYDNALLSVAYLHAWRLTGEPLYRRVVEETLDWAMVEMQHEQGGFYSSLDADSEGVEGKFYVWTAEEIGEALGDDAPAFINFYGVSNQGNWEGHNILYVASTIEAVAQDLGLGVDEVRDKLNRGRQTLYARRTHRTWPGLDDKILTAWNGLMLRAFAEAGRDLERPDYLRAAEKCAGFLHEQLRRDDGRLYRSWKDGFGARYSGYLEDYAYLAEGLLALYQSTFEDRWYAWAWELGQIIVDRFKDEEQGGFYDTADDHEALIVRPKDTQDNAVPSGGAAAANALLTLSLLGGDGALWDVAVEAVGAVGALMSSYPTGFAHWLCAADMILGKPLEVAIAGEPEAEDVQTLASVVYERYRPDVVVAAGMDGSSVALLAGREQIDGRATAYVCRRFVCRLPVTDAEALREMLA